MKAYEKPKWRNFKIENERKKIDKVNENEMERLEPIEIFV